MERRFKIVLATTSIQRINLLQQIGLPFEAVSPGEVDEFSFGEPRDVVIRNALVKARPVVDQLDSGIVVGVDTIVLLDNRIMGKARDPIEAEAMLKALRGREHRILSGFAIVDTSTVKTLTDIVETRVRMLPLSDGEIAAYVSTGEPIGKAGGYAIQGIGGALIEQVDGDFYNVVGLPLSRIFEMLKKFDFFLLEELLINRL